MPTHATPGHPYASQSIHVTSNPLYKKRGRGLETPQDPSKLPFISRPQTGLKEEKIRYATREDRVKTAPPAGYKTAPRITHNKRLITADSLQVTPWHREMYRWFTPDRREGVWHDNEDMDRYRRWAIHDRLPVGTIYHRNTGLMPNYCGYVPGQKFRYGRTWARETTNSRMFGIPRSWESTSYFQDRPIGA